MAHLSAVVTVHSEDVDKRMPHSISAVLPQGPLPLEAFTPLRNWLTLSQMLDMQVGVSALRRAFSSQVLTHLVLRRVNADTLARTDVVSEEALARFKGGGVLVSLPTDPDFRGQGVVGRPGARSIDQAFKHALGEAVARVLRLSAVADREDYEIFKTKYRVLGQDLQTQAALFNLNSDHERHHDFPVLNWCETHGTQFLAAAYGMDEDELEQTLDAAFMARLRTRQFATVLDDELGQIETLIAWSDAHVERKWGVASRRDTTRRILKEHGLDWETAPGEIDPPRMHGKVRRNIVAEETMATLTTRAMIEAAFLFDLEPAYNVFMTRLYLLPILAAAGLAGRVGLRRQQGEIASPVAAGGLVALAENLPPDGVAAPGDGVEDEIGQFQALVRDILGRSGLFVADLAVKGYGHLQTDQPVVVDPPAGPRRFFLDD